MSVESAINSDEVSHATDDPTNKSHEELIKEAESGEVEVTTSTAVNKTSPSPEPQLDQVKAATRKICGVCSENEGKYKCTRCYLPYCSVACSKQHAVDHPPDIPKPVIEVESTPIESNNGQRRPGTVGAGAFQGPFAALDNAPELKVLFKLYPNLREVLEQINTATLPPVDAYTASGLPTSVRKGNEQPWNSDRGLQKGVEALKQARNSDGKDGEAVREYGRLILHILAAEEGLTTEETIQKELAEENSRIIEQLLNGDIG